MSYVIKGDTVVFKSVHTDQDVTLQHNAAGYNLVFGSECVFSMTTEHKTIKMGKFTFELSNDSEDLEIKKNDKTLFKIVE